MRHKYVVTFETSNNVNLDPKEVAEQIQNSYDVLEAYPGEVVKSNVVAVTNLTTNKTWHKEN